MKTYNYLYQEGNLEDIINFTNFLDEPNILVQIFSGQELDVLEKLLHSLTDHLPHAICIGATTDGEICDHRVSTHKTTISITIFKATTVRTTYVEGVGDFSNGVILASELITQRTKLLLLFTDGTVTNAENVLNGIASFSPSTLVCGGMAGDNGKFHQTYVLSQDKILTKGIVGVALDSDILMVSSDYKSDWKTIGLEHTIDEVKDNRIYKINGEAPLKFYEKYLGNKVSLTEFPMIIEKNGILKARAVIAKHEDGSLSCAGNLKKGDKVRIGFGDAKSLLTDPTKAMKRLKDIETETFFIYSCMARRRYMPDLIHLEIEPFSKIAATAGFFTYSEFYHQDGHNELLNQTLTVVALSEQESFSSQFVAQDSLMEEKSEEASYTKTIESLTTLIQQSTQDYEDQSKELEKQMNENKDLLLSHKKFLRYTVHEMNTPLNVIMHNIELHDMEFGTNGYLENIDVAVKSIFSLYDDLSYLVKKNQISYFKQRIDLVDYVRSRVDFFAQVVNKAKSRFLFEVDSQEVFIYFNETKLQRIIDNNLTNAIKYTYENSDIYVHIRVDNDKGLFSIASRSRKIQNKDKIFEENYRENRIVDGFGLGLNLVKTICDEENVGITLHSDDTLTTFTYTFEVCKK